MVSVDISKLSFHQASVDQERFYSAHYTDDELIELVQQTSIKTINMQVELETARYPDLERWRAVHLYADPKGRELPGGIIMPEYSWLRAIAATVIVNFIFNREIDEDEAEFERKK